MTPEEKDDRTQYWVEVLGGTYIAIVVVGTMVMYMGSRVAWMMRRAHYEPRDERLQLLVVVMFLPYYFLLTSLTAWSLVVAECVFGVFGNFFSSEGVFGRTGFRQPC